MFAADSRTLARIEPVIRRTLIVDPNLHAARLLMDIMKALGARDVVIEQTQARALHAAQRLEPGIVLSERSGFGFDGEAFAKALRRSHLECRQAPIIVITADATATTILGARDAGVHEFLRKPFTSTDLFKRVANVALKPRDWIEGVAYVGPDRRRFNSGEYSGAGKRRSDRPATGAAALTELKDQAMRILMAALDQFDQDPAQAVRAARQQAETLKDVAMKTADARLAVASAGLEQALASGQATKTGLSGPISAVLALADPASLEKADQAA